MTQNILQLLIGAVKAKHRVAIRYYDQPEIRVIEPHAIYISETGETVCDAYQIRGYSSSGRNPPFWRPFRLKKVASLTILREPFSTRLPEGFMPHKPAYRRHLLMMVDHGERAPHFPTPPRLEEVGPPRPGATLRR